MSLINTINSIVAVDLDHMAPMPTVDGKGTHGGYCGPAVKPIALNMVAEIARDPETPNLPISGIGGISSWRDAAEFMVLGAGSVQVCTAAMHYGFRIVSDLRRIVELDGREGLRDARRHPRPRGAERDRLEIPEPEVRHQGAHRPDRCIQCGLCHIACEDTSHQAITATKDGVRHFEVVDSECVGCNLCMHVCPVEQCITMERVDSGDYANWTTHPNNPASADAGRVQARRHPRSTRRRLLDGVRRGRSSCIVAFRSTRAGIG